LDNYLLYAVTYPPMLKGAIKGLLYNFII